MKRDDIVAVNCIVGADGSVTPFPGYGGPATSDGPFHGNCHFTRFPARKGEKEMIVCGRLDEDSIAALPLIQVVSRDIVYFYLEVERLDGYFNGSAWPLPTVGGAYPSVLNYADYPSGGASGPAVDPSTVLTDAEYGWTVPDPSADPYYLTHGASIWVAGFEGFGPTTGEYREAVPGYSGWVDLPDREVIAVGDMRTLSHTVGLSYYEWDVYAVTVREYRYEIYTWAEWWGLGI